MTNDTVKIQVLVCESPSDGWRPSDKIQYWASGTNGGCIKKDKGTQNLWSMRVDVRCCGGVFLLKAFGHMASLWHNRVLFGKKMQWSSVRRLSLCHGWTIQKKCGHFCGLTHSRPEGTHGGRDGHRPWRIWRDLGMVPNLYMFSWVIRHYARTLSSVV